MVPPNRLRSSNFSPSYIEIIVPIWSCWQGLRLAGEVGGPTLPLAGRIAAGQPIETIPGEDALNLTDFLLGPDRYALRVTHPGRFDGRRR